VSEPQAQRTDSGDIAQPTIRGLIRPWANRTPDAVAIAASGPAPLTYAHLARQLEALLAQLNELGVGRGDRVALVLPNGPEMAVAFLAVASAAPCAPLNPDYRATEFDFFLSDLEARAIVLLAGAESPAREVAAARRIPIIELVPHLEAEAGIFTLTGASVGAPRQACPAEPEDVALVMHTSGTTSRPKMVPLTHRNVCAGAANVLRSLQLSPDDRCLNVMPLFHIHGLVAALLASLAAGASVVCTPGFLATHFFDWLDELRPTWYTAVPTMHQSILGRAEQKAEMIARRPLRLIRSSSSALPPQVMAGLEKAFGAPVIEAYGMTEASHQMASNPLPPRPRKPGSVGLPAGPEIAVMNEAGDLLPRGERGEIVIQGANVTCGYEKNPQANAEAFTHGWFRTGDQGTLDEEGYLFLTGRLKEIINRGGEKISPREIDEVLMDHPAVAQAVAFALPDRRLGEDVAAAVVLRPGAKTTARELRRFAAGRLAQFKVPSRVVILDEIPKGPTGKLQRIGLAEKLGISGSQEAAAGEREPFVAPRNPVEETVAALWRDVLRVDEVGVNDRFLDLGGDSLLATMLLSRIRESLQLEISLTEFFEAPTVAAQARLIEELLLREIEDSADAESKAAGGA
jgi:acyl-CoA synthetase (AMP-forming)/AMP-acid ligase II/acyl carrier protein